MNNKYGSRRFECPICYEDYKTPKVTPCGHTFCLQCLKEFIGDKKINFRCPVCSQEVKIPEGGAEKFITIYTLQPPTSSNSRLATCQVRPIQSLTRFEQYSSNGTNNRPPNFRLSCPNHGNRVIDYYCKTCNKALCAKCVLVKHQTHTHVDLANKDTRTKVLDEICNCEQFLRGKIEGLEKYQTSLQDACEKLQYFCDESCIKITSKTDKILNSIQIKRDHLKDAVRDNFERNDKRLTELIANNIEQIETLKLIGRELLCLNIFSTSDIVQSLQTLNHIEKQCNNIKTVIPEVMYLELTESEFLPSEEILGSLHPKTFHIQCTESLQPINTPYVKVNKEIHALLSESDLRVSRCYRFNNSLIRLGEWYYSQDKWIMSNVSWSCRVVLCSDDFVYFDIIPLKPNNPDLVYINISYRLTLLNTDISKSIEHYKHYSMNYIWNWGDNLYCGINSNKLKNAQEGFVNNEGIFSVRFEIIQVHEVIVNGSLV